MNQRIYKFVILILVGVIIYQCNELNEETETTTVQDEEDTKELLESQNKDIESIYSEVVRVPTDG